MSLVFHKLFRKFGGAPAHDEQVDKYRCDVEGCNDYAQSYPHRRCSDAFEDTHNVEHEHFRGNKQNVEYRKVEYESFALHYLREERENKTHRTPDAKREELYEEELHKGDPADA